MTAKTRAVLKMQFQTGDIPTGADYVDLIDSSVILQDTSAQVFAAAIEAPQAKTSTLIVSAMVATNIVPLGVLSASTLNASLISAQVINSVTVDAPIVTVSAVTLNAFRLSGQVANASAVNASLVSAQSLNASAFNVATLSAQVVRASAVHHKNAHALVYFSDNNVSHNIVTASAYASLSGALSASPDGMVGFTQNGSTTLTYTGSVTAAMLVEYAVQLTILGATANQNYQTSLFKNGVQIPESLGQNGMSHTKFVNYTGHAITTMKTNDALTLRMKTSTHSDYSVGIPSFMISCHPVSF